MSTIPFFLIITKPNKHKIQTKIIIDVGADLDDIHNKIIYIIQEELSTFKYLPENVAEFISECWYKDISADAEPFEYKFYYEDKWSSLWSIEELYDEVYEVLHKMELLAAYVNEANQDPEVEDDDQPPESIEI